MRRAPGTAERIARNALLKAAGQATRLLSLAFVITAARVLGPEGFGKFTFAYALAAVLGATLDLGMHAILVREVARAREAAAAAWAAGLTLKLALLLPAGLVFAAFPVLTGRPADTTLAAWLLGLALVLQSLVELAVSVFTGFERLEFELIIRIVEKLLLVVVGAAGLFLGGRLVLVAAAFAAAAGLSLVLAVRLVHRHFARLAWRLDVAGARALARRLGPVAGAFLLAVATTRVVPLLVALLAGDVAAGHLGAAVRVLDVVMVVPVIFVAGVYPVLSRTGLGEPAFRRLTVQATELLLMLGLAVGLTFTHGAAWIIGTAYGDRYAPATALLAVLSAAACLGFLTAFLGFVLLALDRAHRLLLVAAISLTASLLLTPVLVRASGALGGAVMLVLVEAITLAGLLTALLPFVRLPFGRGAVKMGAAALAGGLLPGLLPAGSGWRLGIALAVYAGGLVALRPVPAGLWPRLLRGVVGPVAEPR